MIYEDEDVSVNISRINPWAIVLAGGEGERMRPYVGIWLGEDRPKQYCAFVGSRSMVQHTLDRAFRFVPPERTILVIRDGHRRFLDDALSGNRPGLIIEQPADRGTAVAVFAALSYVLNLDPDAVVLLLPSDHFVHPEERFVRYAARACLIAAHLHGHMVMLGALPDEADRDLKWIMPGPARGLKDPRFAECGVRPVANFHEKPETKQAMYLLEHGALISTTITAVQGQFLWALARRLLPRVIVRFDAFRETLRAAMGGVVEESQMTAWLKGVYDDVDAVDFSRDLLEQARGWSLVLRMDGILWSDWSRVEAIMGSLDRLGRQVFTEGNPRNPDDGATPPRPFGRDVRPGLSNEAIR